MYKPNNARIKYYDVSRGICYILVSWIHATFFLMAFYPPELFYYTSTPFFMTVHENIMWAISEQIAPPSFFILMGISIELTYKNKGEYKYISNSMYLRALFIFLISFIIKASYLMGPLSSINELSADGKTSYILFGIFIALAFSLATANLIRVLLKTIFPINYWKYTCLIGLIFLILSGFIEVFDSNIDKLVNNLPSIQQSIFELLLFSGKTGFFKCSFSMIPWLGYALLGITYINITKKNFNKYEVFIAGVLISIFSLIHYFENNNQIIFSKLFIITKYPPSFSLSLLSISFFLLLINFTKFIERTMSKSKILECLSFIGENTFFIYSAHFYFFGLIGLLIKNIYNDYITSFVIFYMIWIIGTILLFCITKLFVKYRKNTNNEIMKRYILRFF